MNPAGRGWARVVLAALVLAGYGWSCAQSRAADAEVDRLKDRAETAERSYMFALETLAVQAARQRATDSAANERVGAANDRAAEAQLAAEGALDRARNITRQALGRLSDGDSADVALAAQEYERAIDSLRVVIDQKDSVIVQRELQILARDERLFAFEAALTAADSTIAAQKDVIAAQDRARGWRLPLLGWRLDMKCGPTVAAGVTVAGRLDVVGGVGCAVG